MLSQSPRASHADELPIASVEQLFFGLPVRRCGRCSTRPALPGNLVERPAGSSEPN